jgi:Protein of unknown function (DUF3592)
MRRKSDKASSAGLPPQLLRSTPRRVRLSAAGAIVAIAATAAIVAGLWGGIALYKRAKTSERRVDLFASEGVATRADIIDVERQGDTRPRIVHYRYAADGQEHTGRTVVRGPDRDRYQVGSQVTVRFLRSEPGASWMEGYRPRQQPVWPAFAAPAASALAAFGVALLLRRQSYLLAYGRPAVAVVTKVEKRRSDHGTRWRVHYEWRLLSGGRRAGRYDHGKKKPPDVGTPIPIVYDRDQPSRCSRYPLSLVTVRGQTPTRSVQRLPAA